MTDHKIGTRAEWQTARDGLAKLEAEHAKQNAEIKRRRLELPWVPVEKKYEFETDAGRRTLADLFEGRSQLLAYNIMFGPDYELGACPGCSNLVDHLDAAALHLGHRDVTLMLLLARADRSARRLQAADGLAAPLRLDLRNRVPVRFRARVDQGAGAEDPRRSQGILDDPAGVAAGLGEAGRREARGRPPREPELHCLRSRERERSITPTRCRRPIRSLLPTTRSCRSGRRRRADESEPRSWRKDEYPPEMVTT